MNISLYVVNLLIIGIAAYEDHHFLVVLQAYALLTCVRFVTILLVPLEAPAGIVVLQDPLTDRLFYQGTVITKDLFFSGHTAILMLMAFGVPFRWLQITLFLGALAVGCMLLIQHAHYSIDVLAAPAFAWLTLLVSRKIHRTDPKTPSAG